MCWGSPEAGGDCSAVEGQLRDVKQLKAAVVVAMKGLYQGRGCLCQDLGSWLLRTKAIGVPVGMREFEAWFSTLPWVAVVCGFLGAGLFWL